MAITQNPIIGRAKKSAGGMTFYTLGGQNIIKAKPHAVANPNTPAQQAQRLNLAVATALSKAVIGDIEAFRKSSSPKRTIYSDTNSYLLQVKNFAANNESVSPIEQSSVLPSSGSRIPSQAQLVINEAFSVNFTIPSNPNDLTTKLVLYAVGYKYVNNELTVTGSYKNSDQFDYTGAPYTLNSSTIIGTFGEYDLIAFIAIAGTKMIGSKIENAQIFQGLELFA